MADTLADEDLSGADDDTVARTSQADDRILVTLDLDFANIRAYPPCEHAGIVVLRVKNQDKLSVLSFIRRLADASIAQISRADVLRFLADLHRDDIPQMLTAIQSFRFVPLEKNKIYLVADVDASGGNGFFGTLDIVRCEAMTCILGSEETFAEDLDTDLVDVSGDGVFQIITKESLGTHSRSTFGSPPFVYSIRALVSGELVDVSAKYPDYFKNHILPLMEADREGVKAAIGAIDRPPPLSLKDLGSDNHRTIADEENDRKTALMVQSSKLMKSAQLQYVQDDYYRRILGEKTAGLQSALKWVRSDDEELRQFGVDALAVIDSSIAAAELLRIANSEDSAAENARSALLRRAEAHLATPPPNATEKE